MQWSHGKTIGTAHKTVLYQFCVLYVTIYTRAYYLNKACDIRQLGRLDIYVCYWKVIHPDNQETILKAIRLYGKRTYHCT